MLRISGKGQTDQCPQHQRDHRDQRRYPDLESHGQQHGFPNRISDAFFLIICFACQQRQAEDTHGKRNADGVGVHEGQKHVQQRIEQAEDGENEPFLIAEGGFGCRQTEPDAQIHGKHVEKQSLHPVGGEAKQAEKLKIIAQYNGEKIVVAVHFKIAPGGADLRMRLR